VAHSSTDSPMGGQQEQSGVIDILDVFDRSELQTLQDRFADATSVGSLITYPDGTPITQESNFCRLCSELIRGTEKGLTACRHSDRVLGGQGPVPRASLCLSAGLMDAGASIIIGTQHVANWLIGQVRPNDSSDESMRAFAREIGADETEFMTALADVPVMSPERFASIVELLHEVAERLSALAFQNIRQRQLLAELAESGQLNQQIIDNANEGIVVYGPDLRYRVFNPFMERLAGVRSSDVLGKFPSDAFPFLAETGLIERLWSALDGTTPEPIEFPYDLNGVQGWTVDRSAPLRDSDGNVVGVLASVQDVSDSKHALEELRASEAKYRVLTENMADVVWTLDPVTQRFLYVSPSVKRLRGYTPEEVMAEPVDAALSPEAQTYVRKASAERLASRLAGLIDDDTYFTSEVEQPCKDGSTVWTEVVTCFVLDPETRTVEVHGVTRDISERKQTQDAVARAARSAEARLRIIDFSDNCTLDQLLEKTLDEAEQLTGSQIGFYHFVDADQVNLRLQNWSTRTKSQYCKADGKGSHYPVSSAGVWADCLRRRAPVVHNDYMSLESRKGLPEGHAALVRELTVPVIRGGLVVAIVGLGNKPTEYDAIDIEMVERLADLTWDITERKRAEEELRASSERLNMALAATGEGLYDLNLLTGKATVSPEYWEMLGEAGSPLTFDLASFSDRVHPDERDRVNLVVERMASGEIDEYREEFRMRHAAGRWVWVLSVGRVVEWTTDGRPSRMLGGHTDITQSLQTAQALERAQTAARMGAWRLDLASGRASAPTETFRIYGVDPADYDGNLTNAIDEVVHPDDRQRLAADLESARFDRVPRHMEYRIIHPDGSIHWVHGEGEPEVDAAGEVVAFAGFVQDITERKLAECALRDSEQLLSQSQSVAHLGHYVLDARTGVWTSSAALDEIFGIDCDYVRSIEGWLAIVHPDERDDMGAYVAGHVLADREPFDREYRISRISDSAERWVRGLGVLEFDEAGDVARMFGVIQDITESKHVERALQARTDELERSNTELQRFAYVASHDLREPLRMVTSYTQLLKKRYGGQLDSDADDFIGFAVDGAARMEALIQELLSYSRVGSQGRAFDEADLGLVLDGFLKGLEVAIAESGAEVTHDPMPVVDCDASQIGQVFQNLVANAIRFRGEEPLRIHVGAELDGGEWVISVADNGIGIEAEYFERIFVIFQRLQPRDLYEGSGMGLAICKRIVERHHGRIWVESALGEGSTFYFTIPA